MFVELAVLGTAIGIYNHYFSSKSKFMNRFDSVIEGIGINNKLGNTFTIRDLETTRYGYKAVLNIPPGLSVSHLENKLNILEDNLNGIINLDKDKFYDNLTLRIVNKDVSKFIYEPVKCSSDKLYLGKDYKLDNYFIDLNKHPMILIAGATGYGKSMLLACILTNLIYNYPKDVEIYLTQLIKGEISSFEDCDPVKFTAYNEIELMLAANKVRSRIDERTSKFKEHGIRNITQWNKHFPTKRMKRIFLVCEEMSELMQLDVWEDIWGIVKAGRSVGIHLIGALQRTTATNLDTNVKSQMTRVTFHQNSIIDSQNVINSNSAMKLKQGECIVCGNDGEIQIKVPFIDDDFVVLNKYVPEIRIPSEEEKIEIQNIKKENDQILMIEAPQIVDVDPVDIKEVKSKKKRKGVVSWEEIQNAERKG